MKRSLTLVVAALLVLLGAIAVGRRVMPASSSRLAAPPAGITARGQLLWNFEALLRQTFGGESMSVSRPENFSCRGDCAPLLKYRLYRYTFSRAGGSKFHIAKRTFGDNGEFGNYPVPVLINGHAVACNAQETRFLIAYRSMASFTVDCLPKPR
jgi:hypothetical protein